MIACEITPDGSDLRSLATTEFDPEPSVAAPAGAGTTGVSIARTCKVVLDKVVMEFDADLCGHRTEVEHRVEAESDEELRPK